MKVLLLLLVCIVVPTNAEDACADWLLNVFGGKSKEQGWCELLARDTLNRYREAPGPKAPLWNFTVCACGLNAEFTRFYFSATDTAQQNWTGYTFTNDTIYLLQNQNQLNVEESVYWNPFHKGCDQPTAAETKQTIQRAKCELGLLPDCNVAPHKKVLQFYVEAKAFNMAAHTFVVQRAADDEFYVWQGFVGQYDMWAWIQQIPNIGRNYSYLSPYAGKLNRVQFTKFMDDLETVGSGTLEAQDAIKLFSELFWVKLDLPPPSMWPCGLNPKSKMGIYLSFWGGFYKEEYCANNWEALKTTAWNKKHQEYRDHLCDGANKNKHPPCPQGKVGMNHLYSLV